MEGGKQGISATQFVLSWRINFQEISILGLCSGLWEVSGRVFLMVSQGVWGNSLLTKSVGFNLGVGLSFASCSRKPL